MNRSRVVGVAAPVGVSILLGLALAFLARGPSDRTLRDVALASWFSLSASLLLLAAIVGFSAPEGKLRTATAQGAITGALVVAVGLSVYALTLDWFVVGEVAQDLAADTWSVVAAMAPAGGLLGGIAGMSPGSREPDGSD